MKYSYNWIKELSGTSKTAEEIGQLLLTHSFEIESIDDLSVGLDMVVIGEVLTMEKHPDADRLNVATVTVGKDTLQIVCGAPNLAVGQKVPVALVGAHLPCGITIAKSMIRGVESNGMICAEDELGIGGNHEGIIVLDAQAPVGEFFSVYTGRNDFVIDIKILPNRGHDCLSHIGIANEIMALEGKRVVPVTGTVPHQEAHFDAQITTDACQRYIAVKMKDISSIDTPAWITHRLRTCDIKPINVVVDITNYVMLETGQPLHAFDASRVDRVLVRRAKTGEKIVLLDGLERTLTEDDLVITDGTHPIALAGVMGGKDSGISDETTDIVLESASFHAPTIRYTQRRYNLLTDAAFRFERDLDPNLAAYAIQRATTLLEEICKAKIHSVVDVYPAPISPWHISLSVTSVSDLLGIHVSHDVINDILMRLGMDIAKSNDTDTLLVTVPTIRRDLTTQEDLIEEIGRVYGYDKIGKKPLREQIIAPTTNVLRQYEHRIMDICVTNGFDEIKGYSYYAREDAMAIGIDDEKHITVLNPLTPEYAIMRRSLIPELCRAAKKNLSHYTTVRLCDIGRIYDPTEHVLPEEKLILGLAVASRLTDGSQFYEIKGLVENICAQCNVGHIFFDDVFDENAEHIPDLHTTRRAMIRTESGVVLGWIGEATKRTHKFYGIKKDRIAVGELYMTRIIQAAQAENFYEPLPKFPFVTRDISMRVGDRTRVADVESTIYAVAGEILKDVDLFDLYDDPETQERSFAFHLIFGSDDRTLTSDEVDALIVRMINALEEDPTIEVRSK